MGGGAGKAVRASPFRVRREWCRVSFRVVAFYVNRFHRFGPWRTRGGDDVVGDYVGQKLGESV